MFEFFQMYPPGNIPIRADKAALGAMPIQAFRYCEPMRVASSHGWYIFPPVDIELVFDGLEVFLRSHDKWTVLSSAYLPGYTKFWNEHAPSYMRGLVPPYLRALKPERGAVQIWSGLLVRSSPGWWSSVRGIANFPGSNTFRYYEAVVETDRFSVCPLFMNIEIIRTNIAINISKNEPLFQIQPVQREAYLNGAHQSTVHEVFPSPSKAGTGLTDQDWSAFRKTIHTGKSDENHRVGDYARDSRKSSKGE